MQRAKPPKAYTILREEMASGLRPIFARIETPKSTGAQYHDY
jgi:hypothetical protein